MEIYKNMKKLYNKRSDIIHRGMSYLVSEADISEICKYAAWSILSLMHLRSIKYTTMNEVNHHINRLYSQMSN